MKNYYSDELSAEQLKRCYEIANPRVIQYLEEELNHVLQSILSGDTVLDLGCGYGRIIPQIARKAGLVIGIDISFASLVFGREILDNISNVHLLNMDALLLGFHNDFFDRVICIQNGISAFHLDRQDLLEESVRVTKPGGTILFSTYSDKFWESRLEWFQLQSDEGLLGEIDLEKTVDGTIVCKDGFTGTIVRPQQFLSLTSELNVDVRIEEVDESSIFCEIIPK